jgi:hypothetical protein
VFYRKLDEVFAEAGLGPHALHAASPAHIGSGLSFASFAQPCGRRSL